MRAAVDGAGPTGVIAVTVLTSFDDAAYAAAIGVPGAMVVDTVLRLADRARACGARGIVCAGTEAGAVRRAHGEALGTLVPGLRPAGAPVNDQARVATPREVRDAGATWVIVGRAVTAASDPAQAYEEICVALG